MMDELSQAQVRQVTRSLGLVCVQCVEETTRFSGHKAMQVDDSLEVSQEYVC